MDINQAVEAKKINLFERYLTLWVALCMGVGIFLGKAFPGAVNTIRSLEFGEGSQINIPIAVLIWLMIYPMMLKVDFGSIAHTGPFRPYCDLPRQRGLLTYGAVHRSPVCADSLDYVCPYACDSYPEGLSCVEGNES